MDLVFEKELPPSDDYSPGKQLPKVSSMENVESALRVAPTWSSWIDASEVIFIVNFSESLESLCPKDDASSEDFADFSSLSVRKSAHLDDESSDDITVMRQHVTALSPLQGEEGFELTRSLQADFAIPAAISGAKSSVDKNLIFCDPPCDIQVYFKNSNALVISPVGGKWQGSTTYSIQGESSFLSMLCLF